MEEVQVPSPAEGEATASEASVCGLEGDCRQANGRGVFIHRGRSKEVRQWPEARDSRSSWAQVDPEVVAKLDEVRKAKGMTPRAVSDEDRFEVPVLLTSLRPLQLPVPRVGSTRTPSADDWHAADAVEEICERLFFSMINEGFKILEETLCQLCRQASDPCLRQRIGQEGFVARSSDIDLAYIYGYGFPPAKAGILCTCTVGAKAFQFRCRGLGCAQICASEHSVKPACRVPL